MKITITINFPDKDMDAAWVSDMSHHFRGKIWDDLDEICSHNNGHGITNFEVTSEADLGRTEKGWDEPLPLRV